MMSGAFAKRLEEFNHPDFVNRLKTGNEAAYRELVDGMLPWAKNFVKKKYSLSEEDAKDIAQDLFQRIIEKIDQYEANEGRFMAWAFQILRNLTVDWLRRNKKIEIVAVDPLQIDEMVPSRDDDSATKPKDDLSPLEKLPNELRMAFLKLNERYQRLLGLMLLGTSDEAIRKVLEIPNEGALWTLRSRALAKLKEEFEKITSTKGGQ
jgi:RNA polymerase sigma-70 factor (ECF subfamily)